MGRPGSARGAGRGMRTLFPWPHSYGGVLFLDLAAGQFVRLADAADGVHAIQDTELVQQLRVDGAEHGHNAALNPANHVVLEAQFPDMFSDSRCLLVRPALKLGPQDPGAVEVDVDQFASLLLRVDVEEDAQAPGEGTRDIHLVSAEKGDVGPADLPGGQGGA